MLIIWPLELSELCKPILDIVCSRHSRKTCVEPKQNYKYNCLQKRWKFSLLPKFWGPAISGALGLSLVTQQRPTVEKSTHKFRNLLLPGKERTQALITALHRTVNLACVQCECHTSKQTAIARIK